MTNTFADFQRELGAMKADMVRKRRAIVAGTTQDAFESLVIGHPVTGAPGQPVDTGYLRNSFALYTDAPNFPKNGTGADSTGSTESPERPANPDPAVVLRMLSQDVPEVTVATNTVYAEVWEHRHPTKAGNLRLTVAGMDRLVDRNFKKVYPSGGAR
jgi:hypothetical protein